MSAARSDQAPPFRGWPIEAKQWFEGLEADNSRTWFHANKRTYDASVRQPIESLLAELDGHLGEVGAGKVFRPNRDTRFSADKSPYKTAAAALITRPGGSGYYLQLSSAGLFTGAGTYSFDKQQLERYRSAVDDDRRGRALAAIVDGLVRAKYELGGAALATAPRGYAKDHARVELLRHKGLYAGRSHPWRKWVSTAEAKDRITADWQTLDPLLDWLDANVGGSSEWG
jgi:uncharacterized protein (TIGR02453 family)